MAVWPCWKRYSGSPSNPQRTPQTFTPPIYGPVGGPYEPILTVGVPYGAFDSIRMDVQVHKATPPNWYGANFWLMTAPRYQPRIIGDLNKVGRTTLVWDAPTTPLSLIQHRWETNGQYDTGAVSPYGLPSWAYDRDIAIPVPPTKVPLLTCVPIPASIHVYLNGVEQWEVDDWNLLPPDADNPEYRIESTAGMGEMPGDLLEVRYACAGSGAIQEVTL